MAWLDETQTEGLAILTVMVLVMVFATGFILGRHSHGVLWKGGVYVALMTPGVALLASDNAEGIETDVAETVFFASILLFSWWIIEVCPQEPDWLFFAQLLTVILSFIMVVFLFIDGFNGDFTDDHLDYIIYGAPRKIARFIFRFPVDGPGMVLGLFKYFGMVAFYGDVDKVAGDLLNSAADDPIRHAATRATEAKPMKIKYANPSLAL